MIFRRLRRLVPSAMIAAVTVFALVRNARPDDPPRYDGAGYAVLACSLLGGEGYREIDHPDAPLHAHFPPGYPLVLAGLWRIVGTSNEAAHSLSIACTLGAILLAHGVFRRWFGSRIGLILGLSLAMNWRWGREGSSIQSEPLFCLLSLAIVVVSRRFGRVARKDGGPNLECGSLLTLSGGEDKAGASSRTPKRRNDLDGRAIFLGGLMAATMLVRHVGACVAVAILIDLLWKKKYREATISAITAGVVIAPWLAWMAKVGHHTQVGLFPGRNLPAVIAENAIFYLRRLPDQIFGPFIEVATVFRSASWSQPATALALALSTLILTGWLRVLRSPRKRLAGLIPTFTLALLLLWPFTEAGRFLVPLIPFVLIGFMEGLGLVFEKMGVRQARFRAAILVLALSLPYSLYAMASNRAEAARRTHAQFDRACLWIASQSDDPGPVLTRHPGELFLRSGRKSLSPGEDSPIESIEEMIENYRVSLLLIDEARFANAPATPLEKFVARRPNRVQKVYGEGSAVVYRIKPG